MSKPISESEARRVASSPPSASLQPDAPDSQGPRLPPPGLARKLFLILSMALRNLDSEISPGQPKSIWTKARDLCRNIPHWQAMVAIQPITSEDGSVLFDRAKDAAEEVCRAAQEIRDELAPLVNDSLAKDVRAGQAWSRLQAVVQAALGHIGGEFSPTAQSPSLSASMGGSQVADGQPPSESPCTDSILAHGEGHVEN